MIATKTYAAASPTSPLAPHPITRRTVGPHDVHIKIRYCGICHSDLHTARGEWPGTIYPVVPGHEIVGEVVAVGSHVKKFKVGDLAGVGCLVDSCRTCEHCNEGLENFCDSSSFTYSSYEQDKKTVTYGGYSDQIVVDERFTLTLPANLPLEGVAPLLCAGITTYSPLRTWQCGPGMRVAVLGLGGLGHMAVKLASAMGAEVTMLSTSASKAADAKRLGAHHFVNTKEEGALGKLYQHFHLIIDTVSAPHDLNAYLMTLRRDGTMVLLGVPPEPTPVAALPLIFRRRRLVGSLIGGLPETQEMLDFCGQHGITSDVEVIPIQQVNEAYERLLRSDVRYRFVIDMASLE